MSIQSPSLFTVGDTSKPSTLPPLFQSLSANTSSDASIFDQRFPIGNTGAYTVGRPFDDKSTDIVFCGEGDFGLARSLVEKHENAGKQNFAQRVLATEYEEHDSVLGSKPKAKEHIIELYKRGSQIAFNFDATQLSRYVPNGSLERAQFTCPHDRKNYFAIPKTLPPLVEGFFKSAKEATHPEGTIHLVIAQPPGSEALYQDHHFGIINAAKEQGLTCVDNFPFSGRNRYYEHNMTNKEQSEPSPSKKRRAKTVRPNSSPNAIYNREFVLMDSSSNAVASMPTSHLLGNRVPGSPARLIEEHIRIPHGPYQDSIMTMERYEPTRETRNSFRDIPPPLNRLSDDSEQDLGLEMEVEDEDAFIPESNTSIKEDMLIGEISDLQL